MSAMPLLAVRAVSKRFGGLKAVSDASLDVARGEIVALVGPNGAGKTTLFNLIAGAMPADAGSILVDGQQVVGLRADQVCHLGVGRTFQIVKPFGDMSVLENVMVGGFKGTRDHGVAHDRAVEALHLLRMDHLQARPASSLTLPDRKRLEVARALATQPRLLLLDEVMAGLRPVEVDEMVDTFRQLVANRDISILLIEHVMRAVMALANRVYVLARGEMIAVGRPDEVTKDPKVLESYFGPNHFTHA